MGLAQPFLILILEGAPLLSRFLRQGGDFDLLFRTMIAFGEIKNPPCPCKERRDKGGAPARDRMAGKGWASPQQISVHFNKNECAFT